MIRFEGCRGAAAQWELLQIRQCRRGDELQGVPVVPLNASKRVLLGKGVRNLFLRIAETPGNSNVPKKGS
jgi:hypothetical protein